MKINANELRVYRSQIFIVDVLEWGFTNLILPIITNVVVSNASADDQAAMVSGTSVGRVFTGWLRVISSKDLLSVVVEY